VNTEYAVGNLRLRFESRARRRGFVALFYAVLAACDLAGFSVEAKDATAAWIVSTCLILITALAIVFSWLAGDMRARGDEREMHRRDHAHFRAYYIPGYGLVAALFAGYFSNPNPITPHLPTALQAFLLQLPHVLLVATVILYISLPQAILLWTEPDMEPAPERLPN
jgi:hypothetical protein